MAININSGLLPAVVKKESTFGVEPLDFTAHDGSVKGLPINQSLDSPINVVDTYNKEVIKSTFGSQVQKQNTLLMGARTVSASFGHQIGLNDFVVIGNMFFQNKYQFIPTITDGTIQNVSNGTGQVTIEVADVGDLKVGEKIIISGRTIADENGIYKVISITNNEITFESTPFDDTDTSGSIKALLNKHVSLIEDVDDCNAQTLENSYSIYLPSKFPDKDSNCNTAQGEIYSGVVPKSLSIDFSEASYSIETIGKSLKESENNPRKVVDYVSNNNPSGDGYIRKRVGTLQKWNETTSTWDSLETLSLNLNINFTVEEDKVQKAGELSRALVDGVELQGTYEALFLTEDDAQNISNSLYENRDSIQSGGYYRLAIENTDGEAIYIDGNIKFYGEELTRELGGWKLKVDFQFLRDDDSHKNIQLTVIDSNNDLSTLL